MKKLFPCLLLSIYICGSLKAQWSDDFSDENMSDDPAWEGNISKFEIDVSQKLHLNAPAEASQAYLSTASGAIGESEWTWNTEIGANPSSTNFCKVYLVSDQAVLDGPLNGYFVKIGGTTDEVSLYRQDGLTETLIINGNDGRVNVAWVQISVKVKRDIAGNWLLETKLAGDTSYTEEGTAFENTHTISSYFGMYCKYTATRSTAFYFDDIVVTGGAIPDHTAPKLLTQTLISSKEISLSFSESLSASSALQKANYLLNGQQAEHIQHADHTVKLTFSSPFPNAVTRQLKVSGIADESNNFIADTMVDIFYFEKVKAVWGSLVINEIFPDPSPSILYLSEESDAEFIELYNPDVHPYDLKNWMINGKPLPAYILHPGAYIILCKPAFAEGFESYGSTLSLSSWPALSNSGGSVVLSDDESSVIDSVSYTTANIVGGFSLERIYLTTPCEGAVNLAVSNDQNGATPGAKNTAFSEKEDVEGPELLNISAFAEDSLLLTFSEKTYIPQPYTSQVTIDDTIFPKQVNYLDVDSSQLVLVFESRLDSHKNHQVKIQQAYDCNTNINPLIHFSFYLDLQPPSVEQIIVLDTAEVLVMFSEKLLKEQAEKESNYTLYPFGVNSKKAVLNNDSVSVLLTFPSSFDIQDTVTLNIQLLEDLRKNKIPAEHPLTLPFVYDSQIESLSIINAYQLDLKFKIVPEVNSALNVLHYLLDLSTGNPARVIPDPEEPKLVHLLLQTALSQNKKHSLTLSNLLNEKNELMSTPRYHFFYDTKGPLITEVKAMGDQELAIHFNENIDIKAGQKLKLWIDKDTVEIESYTLFKNYIHFKLSIPLLQEKTYSISVEGITDIHSNLSSPSQNFSFLLDQLSPRLDTAFVYSPHEIMLIFHEPVQMEQWAAEYYFHFAEPAYIPTQLKFYQLTPEKVLFTFDETIPTHSLHFQINNFSDTQGNRMNLPLDVRVDHQQPGIGHIIPLSNKHILLQFTSDIRNLNLSVNDFLLNHTIVPDSLVLSSASQLELWFSPSFNEFTAYQLEFAHAETKQKIDFQYQDFVESVSHDGKSTVKIRFDVPLEIQTAESTENYTIPSFGHPLAAVYLPEIQSVQLLFKGEIDEKMLHTITIQGIFNIDHFSLPQSEHLFGEGRTPAYQEILISEIMAKPAPSVALPEAEYIELFNASEYPLQLKGLQLADAQKSTTLTEKWLSAGDYIILCSTTDVKNFSAMGQCMGVSGFPSLNDDTDTLSILNASGQEIHKITYTKDWYNNASKSTGGWSLEMIDTAWPCQGMRNWSASEDTRGGTPGMSNSVLQSNPDLQAPVPLQAVADDSLHISILFDEKLGKQVPEETEIVLEGIPIEHITLEKEDHQLKIRLHSPLQAETTYLLTVSHTADCSGNFQSEKRTFDIILPALHQRNDILVSEILFHPRTGGTDFVELYNHSNKHINLKHWKLATLDNDVITDMSPISAETLILTPGAYLAITEDIKILTADYPLAAKGRLFETKTFPSLLADGGTLLLMDDQDMIMQKISFSPDHHHPLLQEEHGVSLERISWNIEENNQQYWQSAASTVGYATPGYQNSQWVNFQKITHQLQVEPPVFFPDQSGYQDDTQIQFKLEGNGLIGNLMIFDARGKMIRQLVQNQSLSEEGFFIWDGTDDSKKRVNIGYYIVWMEVFKPDGSVNVLKSKVVVGSKF